jgi:exonuclease III
MKVLSCYVRGLNSLTKQCTLEKIINQEKPTIVLMQETKCDKEMMTTLANKFSKESKIEAMTTMGFFLKVW